MIKNISILFLIIFVSACNKSPNVTVVSPKPPANTPPETGDGNGDNGEQPKPKEPKGFYNCDGGTGNFAKLEVWWSKATPLTQVFQGDLGICKNQVGQGFDLQLVYPAVGTSLNVNGKAVTQWMMAKVFDEEGIERHYYQYSDFYSRSSGCNQGLFMSALGEVIDIRINEPKNNRGVIILEDQEHPIKCN